MICRMRFFSKFVVANVRDGASEADGTPANAKPRARRFAGSPKMKFRRNETRGKPADEKLGARGSREDREEDSESLALAGSPQKGFLTFDARGSPARGKI